MRHKLIISVFVIVAAIYSCNAQSYNTWSFSSGEITAADHYLSNQQYQGPAIALHANHEVFYKTTQQRVSWNIFDSWHYGQLTNVSNSAMILYFGGHIGFGSHYHYRPVKGFTLKAGALLDIYGALKYQSRNVNNVASADLQTNILASVAAQYKWEWKKWSLALNYHVTTPLFGYMFVPEMGQSYYEVFLHLNECFNDVIHFSSFHNRQGINGNFSVQFILPHIMLHCSLIHDNEWWKANNLKFYNHNLSAQIGFALRLETLSQLTTNE